MQYWEERLESYSNISIQLGWDHFALQASLQRDPSGINDSLERFCSAFQESNFSLFDEDTKSMFNRELGIENPLRFKNELQKFFALSDAEFIEFIKHQTKKGF